MPLFSQAAGLGRLNVMSGLGQPFRGEIDLVSVQPSESDSLVVSLAPPESYSNAQIAYPSASLGLRFNIEKRSNGQYYVVVNSSQPITEPFLDLLVELNWAAGRIQREYTALIDPADYSGGVKESSRYASTVLPGTQNKGAIKGVKSKKTKASAVEANQNAESTKPAPQASSMDGGGSAGSSSHKVKSGETLGAIARQVQPAGVSLEQVLVGLYRANPTAFEGNMNRLKSGKILKVPEAAQLQQTSKVEAAKEIQVQSADWNAYRGKLADSAAKAPAKSLSDQGSGGKISAKVQDQGATAADANKDVLKLSKAADAAKKSGDTAKLQALEEEISTRQKALDEANQRVAALQKNLSDMEKLAALKAASSASMAASASASLAVAVPVAASEASTASAVAASEPASAVAATAKPKRRIQVEAPVVEETSFVDDLLSNPLTLGGGALAVLLGGVGLWWSRRRKNPGVFEDSIITGGDLKANTVLGSTGGGVISTQATENSFLTDFSRQGLGTIDTDEVDPIAEAEVYMAYGRDAQAEEILKDALHKDPTRHEIRMKLLDIYSARKDVTSYEEHASALFAVTNGQGEFWRDAAINGRAIDPENPLYRKEPAGVVDTSLVAPVAVAAAAAVAAPQVVAAALDEPTAPDVEQLTSNELDFELDFDSEVAQVKSPAEDIVAEPFATSVVPELDVAAVDDGLASSLDESADASFDLDVDLQLPEVAPSGEDSGAADGLMSLDLPIDLDSSFGEPAVVNDLDLGDLDLVATPESLGDGLNLPQLEEDVQQSSSLETVAALGSVAQSDDDLKLDFDFDLGNSIEASDFAPNAAPESEGSSFDVDATFGDISLDLTEAAAAGELDFAADDPVQTKIDLAKAYIDMGDVEGAREILQEALQEGSDAQQQTAKSLLAEL
ncbi:hypothetical protein NT239_01460 [Chitinibacter sp. SCUT-21]|uniref:FimV/HubP family polar landmark protein n=1 Tax=Chitinibacter sp. SCUT-21 TaxID=2970891 RepID=UPI0035A5E1E1